MKVGEERLVRDSEERSASDARLGATWTTMGTLVDEGEAPHQTRRGDLDVTVEQRPDRVLAECGGAGIMVT